jgi:hypothetical protein
LRAYVFPIGRLQSYLAVALANHPEHLPQTDCRSVG